MRLWELLLLAVGLSMDACAVAAANGVCCRGYTPRRILATAAVFGGFQGLMPLLGYLLGSRFIRYMARVDHIIALLLLGYLGGRMIWEGLSGGEERPKGAVAFTWRGLFLQGIATSIDALAVGVSLAALGIPILSAAGFIAAVTFCCTLRGVGRGRLVGPALGSRAQLLGGGVLLLIGAKIFLEHTLG